MEESSSKKFGPLLEKLREVDPISTDQVPELEPITQVYHPKRRTIYSRRSVIDVSFLNEQNLWRTTPGLLDSGSPCSFISNQYFKILELDNGASTEKTSIIRFRTASGIVSIECKAAVLELSLGGEDANHVVSVPFWVYEDGSSPFGAHNVILGREVVFSKHFFLISGCLRDWSTDEFGEIRIWKTSDLGLPIKPLVPMVDVLIGSQASTISMEFDTAADYSILPLELAKSMGVVVSTKTRRAARTPSNQHYVKQVNNRKFESATDLEGPLIPVEMSIGNDKIKPLVLCYDRPLGFNETLLGCVDILDQFAIGLGGSNSFLCRVHDFTDS